jgi:hypothetical protein
MQIAMRNARETKSAALRANKHQTNNAALLISFRASCAS